MADATTAAEAPSVGGMSDRQADAAIRRWLELLEPAQTEGLSIGHALKVEFFTEWLKRGASAGSRPVRLGPEGRVLAARGTVRFPRADVVMLRQWSGSREMVNFEGVPDALAGLTVGWAHRDATPAYRPVCWTRLLATHAAHGAEFRRAWRGMDVLSSIAPRARSEFALPESFEGWLRHEAASAIWQFVAARAVLRQRRPKALVSCSDNHPAGYVVHTAARQAGVPSLCIHHGFVGFEWGHAPLWSDAICVWGDAERDWFLDRGTDARRVLVTGNPRGVGELPLAQRDSLRAALGCGTGERLLLWCTTPQGGAWEECFLRWVRALHAGCPQWRIVLRLHPVETRGSYAGLLPDGVKAVPSAEMGLSAMLAAADVVVHDHSSVGVEAHYVGQNVICAAVNPPYPDYYPGLVRGQAYARSAEECVRLVAAMAPPTFRRGPVPGLVCGGVDASRAIAAAVRSLIERGRVS